MLSRPRCACCRRAFSPNYRNRSKTRHPQRYCGEAVCREASLRDSQRRYRRREPEEPLKVRQRVREHRMLKRERQVSAAPPSDAPRVRPLPPDADESRGMRPEDEVLTQLVRQLFVQFPVVADRVAGESCNANAARPRERSRSGISR